MTAAAVIASAIVPLALAFLTAASLLHSMGRAITLWREAATNA